MVKVTGLRTWNMNADSLEPMLAFYRDVLGGEEGRTGTVGGVTVAHLRVGNVTVGLFDASGGPRAGVPHHTFEFEGPADADAAVKELEARGVTVERTRRHGDGPGYSLYLTDPSGNQIELSTDPA